MPTPYSSTLVHVRAAALADLRDDLARALREAAAAPQLPLAFAPEPQTHAHGRDRYRTRARLTPTGGIVSAEVERHSGSEVRTSAYTLVRADADAPVVAHLRGEVNLPRTEESPYAWLAQHRLLQQWQARYGLTDAAGTPMPRVTRVRDATDLMTLADLILDPQRRHCVLVHTDPFEGKAPVRVDDLGEGLAGFAHVYHLPQEFTRDLQARLGHGMEVYNGSVRVYAPEAFRLQVDPYASVFRLHPRWSPRALEEGHLYGQLAGELFEAVAERQVGQFAAVPDVVRQVRQRLRALEAAAAPEAPELDLLEARAAYLDAAAEAADLRERIDALEEERAGLRAELRRLRRRGPANAPEPEAPPAPLAEVLAEATADVPGLEVWPTATAAAEAVAPHAYHEPTVRRALGAVADYARALSEHPEYRLGQPPHTFFHTRGLEYKPHESQSTMGDYARYRTHTHQGQTREVESHLTLNPGGERCTQLYFEADDADRVVRVVYCGAHLPTHTGSHNNG